MRKEYLKSAHFLAIRDTRHEQKKDGPETTTRWQAPFLATSSEPSFDPSRRETPAPGNLQY